MPAVVGASSEIASAKHHHHEDRDSPEAEEARVKRRQEVRKKITSDAFLQEFQIETNMLGVFETRSEKAIREQQVRNLRGTILCRISSRPD